MLSWARRKCLGLDSWGWSSQQSEGEVGGQGTLPATSEQTTSFNVRASGEYVERKRPVCETWNKEKSGSVPDLAV